MWDNPVALAWISRLLLAATIGLALYLSGEQFAASHLNFRQVEVLGAQRQETRAAVPRVIAGMKGGFLSLDLDAARAAFERLPWVREARVRRVWPDRLVVELQEHVPAAAWNDLAVMNVQGELFPVRPWAALPRIYAPEGNEQEVARRYGQFAAMLAPHGWHIGMLRVDARWAWRIGLDDGLTVELGRERLEERLTRFIQFYPRAKEQLATVRRVDMRYPNGFAVQGGGNASSQT